jgi:chromosome segregation ATPase
MKAALEEREAEIARLEAANGALEARVKTLFDDLQIARAEIGLKTDELAQAERVLAHSRNQVNDLRLAHEEREHVLARQAQEIAALKAHIETVRCRIVEFAQDVRQSENLLTYEPDPLMRVASPTLNGAKGSARLGTNNGRSIGPGGGLQLNGAESFSR